MQTNCGVQSWGVPRKICHRQVHFNDLIWGNSQTFEEPASRQKEGYGSVNKVFSIQTRRPDSDPQYPHKMTGVAAHVCNPSTGVLVSFQLLWQTWQKATPGRRGLFGSQLQVTVHQLREVKAGIRHPIHSQVRRDTIHSNGAWSISSRSLLTQSLGLPA